ncbi:MAG: DUF4384 domain-containing protein [Candidatus Cloacimonetes bacterium]|nr:DUF4384 domain-containing protein [Candidatus Cloacimonadota bacterium]
MNKKISFYIVSFVFIVSIIFCENSIPLQPILKELGNEWFEVTATAIIENITPEQAKDIALEKAYKAAIEYFSGIEVTGRTSYIQAENKGDIHIDHFSKLTNQTSQGIILKKEILNEKTELSGNSMYKIITLKVKVGKQSGEKDQNFNVQAELNKEYFKEGECLQLSVIPSIDCYLTIFNIMSDENVATIFPNKFRRDNFIKANQEFLLPNEADKINKVSYELVLLLEKEEDTEIVKIIATKKPINFQLNTDYKTAFESLINWLVTIPRNEMEEIDLQYYIYK